MSDTPQTYDELVASVKSTLALLDPNLLGYILSSISLAHSFGREEVLKQAVDDFKGLGKSLDENR